jgi:hypothetical protein
MNYVLLNDDGQVEKFPFSLSALKKLHPQVSFPNVVPHETLRSFNVFPVEPARMPIYNQDLQKLETGIENVDGVWRETKTVVPLSLEKMSSRIKAKAMKELKDTNDIILSFVERNQKVPPDWVDYRHFLRNITGMSGFPDRLNWPDRPAV